MDSENKVPFKVKDVARMIKKAVVASSLEELRSKVAEKFEQFEQQPRIHLDSDGTEIDDEEYFRTLDANAELIAVFPGEHWIDPSNYVSMSNRDNTDTIDSTSESARLRKLVGELQQNLCNISVMNEADLETLSNMDPNSLVDITGKDLMEQMKDAGRPLCAKRSAADRVNLLKLLKDGAIFCSERYPEEAEAIDMEIRKQLSIETKTITTNSSNLDNDDNSTAASATRRTVIIENIVNAKTIEQIQNANSNSNSNQNNSNTIHHCSQNINHHSELIDSNSNPEHITTISVPIIPTITLTTPPQQSTSNTTASTTMNLNTNTDDI